MRLMQILFFLHSIAFFLLLKRGENERVYKMQGYAFMVVNFTIFLGGASNFVTGGGVKCTKQVTYQSVA